MNEQTSTTSLATEPDDLLISSSKSIFVVALILSLVAHIAFALLTSFSLYKQWAEYGFYSDDYGIHSPSDIKTIRAEKKKEVDQAAKEKAAQEKEEAAMMKRGLKEGDEKGDQDAQTTTKPPAGTEATNALDEKLNREVEQPPQRFDMNSLDLDG